MAGFVLFSKSLFSFKILDDITRCCGLAIRDFAYYTHGLQVRAIGLLPSLDSDTTSLSQLINAMKESGLMK